MIERYSTSGMSTIWSREAKYQKWMEVELAICEEHFAHGTIPAADWESIQKHASFSLTRCDEIEQETRHDLAAFVRNLEENIGPAGRWVHFGVTSYDVIDTALGMMLRDSCDVLLKSGKALSDSTKQLASKHGNVPCIGRTHGIHAEPITFGFKLSSWHAELSRNLQRLGSCKKDISFGKVSGAVGIHAHVSPEMESAICARLGIQAEPVSTQIINRDRMSSLLNAMAVFASGLERIATELRNLQRTEILEVQEEFSAGQTGSSAMPHKRNPWNSETVCGLARLVRANAHTMMESIASWHERDLTNSSLERIILPDTFHLLDFMLLRLTNILNGLVIREDNMDRNLRHMGDLVFSEHLMVALIEKGMTRADAYKVAQRNATKAWDGLDFREQVSCDPDVLAKLSPAELDQLFSLTHHLRNAHHSLKASGILGS